MSNPIYEKFIDLNKKANFWLELIRLLFQHEYKYLNVFRSLPHVCPSQCWKRCFEKSFSAHEKVQMSIKNY